MIEFDNKMRVDLIKTNANDIDVARAAWVSTNAEDARTKEVGRIEGLINFLYSNKHMSPFEHGSFTFFVDCPIFVAREFMRHRTWSYNEVSGRYTEMKPRFYMPPTWRPLVQVGKIGSYDFTEGTDEQYKTMSGDHTEAYVKSWVMYADMTESGIAREVARNPLPLGTYTQFYATCNPRNLMQFLLLRNAPDALWEIRDVAEQLEDFLEETMPLTHKAYVLDRRWAAVSRKFKELYNIEQAEVMTEAAENLRRAVNDPDYFGD